MTAASPLPQSPSPAARERLLALLADSDAVKQGWAAHLAEQLLPLVREIAAEARTEAAVDALMWSAFTVEHSLGIKHQARAVTAVLNRAAVLRSQP